MTHLKRRTTLEALSPIQREESTMVPRRLCPAVLFSLAFVTACASAGDRLNEGIELQSQGRYMEAVYRYAEAVEKDRTLVEAQDRLLAAGDTALTIAMDDADQFERRGDPVAAAGRYRQMDQMLARIRSVGLRLDTPADFETIRRGVFDNAINWQMIRGDEAAEEGRWSEARRFYTGARGEFDPSRSQIDESFEAETRVLLQWAEVELEDGRPRAAHGLAQEALEVRSSPAREVVLQARDLQDQALAAGTVVLAVLPVTADPGVREYLGGEFEIELDEDLALDHWTRPPLFIDFADPLILQRELRGLLRGQIPNSPTLVGRALGLIGADVGVMIEVNAIEVLEDDVDEDTHETVIVRPARPGRGLGRGQNQGQGQGRGLGREAQQGEVSDTVTYTTIEGDLIYTVEAEVILVDPSGRDIGRFTAGSRQTGPFARGEFDGDPALLDLHRDHERFFDPAELAAQVSRIEGAVLEDLAVAIAAGTYDRVLADIR